MRIAVLQFVSAVRHRDVPRFEPNLGTLLSLLRGRGHELSLLGVARYDLPALKAFLARSLPQLIYADISPVCSDVARRTLQHIQDREFLPVVAGGGLATLAPTTCLSLPAVYAIAIGEPDASLVTYLERIKDPAVRQIVQGVWLRDERGLSMPALPALVEELDSLPLAERDLFNYAAHVARTGSIDIAVGRGCPQKCGYCPNEPVSRLYRGHGTWVRRRSPQHVIDEIGRLRSRYAGVRTVRFLDHAFALDESWLGQLLELYGSQCGLPFRCHLRANSLSRQTVERLAAAGCNLADVEVISGSDFIRNEIFAMELSNEQIIESMSLLHAAGIAPRVIVYLGSPYESDASLDETAKLLRLIKPALVDVRPYYPWPGTDAEATVRENGWLHSRGEDQYHDDAAGIHMPACRPEVISAAVRRFRAEFPTELGDPWWRRFSQASRAAFVQLFQRRR